MTLEDFYSTRITVYRNVFDKVGHVSTMGDFLSDESHYPIVNKIRQSDDPEEIKGLKQRLTCATLSALSPVSRTSETEYTHTGFICIDVDGKDNPTFTAKELKRMVSACRQVIYCAYSVSGQGCFAIIPVERPEHHKGHFAALQRLFRDRMGIVIDAACSDVKRLRFATCDPYPYINITADAFKVVDPVEVDPVNQQGGPAAPEGLPYQPDYILSDDEQLARVEWYITAIEQQGIDIAPTYDDWVRLAYALHTLGPKGFEYLCRASAMWQSPTGKTTTERELKTLWSHIKGDPENGVTIATFYKMCHDVGIDHNDHGSCFDDVDIDNL